MKSKAAFTKIEFLVTIACLVFLLANIAAVGPAGRSHAQEAACLSNLMKWGQIFQIYTAGNNGYFHQRTIGNSMGYSQMWLYTYEPYYGDRMMLCCPAADKSQFDNDPFGTWGGPYWDPGSYGSWDPDDPYYSSYYGSYGFNRYIVNMQGAYANDSVYFRRAGYKGADNIPVLLDCLYVTLWFNDYDQPPEYEGDMGSAGIGLATINRHNGGVNVCFMDFSARKVGLKELWTLKGNRFFDTCNNYTICGWGGDAQACADFWDSQAPWMSEFPEY